MKKAVQQIMLGTVTKNEKQIIIHLRIKDNNQFSFLIFSCADFTAFSAFTALTCIKIFNMYSADLSGGLGL